MRYLPIVITGAVCISCYADEPLSLPDFVTIPEGTFSMGCCCPEGRACLCEYPLHEVTVSSFEMMAHEVSQSFWIEVLGSNPSLFNGGSLPVERVTWQMCQEFISELNRRDDQFEYRLPSEAEWEYACKAGTSTAFHWGDSCADSLINLYCWSACNSDGHTREVGSMEPNQFGLYDMNGNVWEWCLDHYHDSYSSAPCDGSEWLDSSETRRIARGGCWFMNISECRSSFRVYAEEDFTNHLFGLRLVRTPRNSSGTGIALH